MTENLVDKTAKKQRGRPFKKGQSGNPKGRPSGSGISITTEIKRKLEEVPEGEKATNLQLLLDKILTLAVSGDQRMIKDIWSYVDGMPKQSMEVEGKGELTVKLVSYAKKKKSGS